NDVNGLAYRHSFLEQRTVNVGALFSHTFTEHFIMIRGQNVLSSCAIIAIVMNALKIFEEGHFPNYDNTLDNTRIERVCVSVLYSIEVIDPDAGINQHHLPPLISSKLPSHLIFPRNLRIFCWWLRRTSSFRPCSTASFLVVYPDAFSASAISFSSMTMLVLMGHLCVYFYIMYTL